jgi:DNA-binding beta-propeller fold protein YncE
MQNRRQRKHRYLKLAVAAWLSSALAFALPSIAAEPYHLAEKLHLDGDVRWDYLSFDSAHKRLFVTRGDHVDVFDTVGKRVIGTIPDTHGVHGVALAPELDRGFTSNGRDNAVTVFELAMLKVVTTVATGENPDAIVFDPDTRRVFSANAKGQSLTAIDAVSGSVVGTIALGGKPEFAVVDGAGLLFVNIEDKNQLVAVDTRKLKVVRNYDLSPVCTEPAGLAIESASKRLFVTCHNDTMAVIDTYRGGRVIASVPIGHATDAAIYDNEANLAFSSNGDGTLTVVGIDAAGKYAVRQTVNTMPGARTMALDPVSHAIYLVSAEFDRPAPAPAAEQKESSRPRFKPGTFTLLIVSP